MSRYRCSACGSPNVVVDYENGGYSYSKGIVGTVVFGAPGAVAGINGKTKQVFKCPDCGLTLSSPMSDEIKLMIDLGIASKAARNNLTLNGSKIDWTTLTKKYKNIEKSYVDEQISGTEKTSVTTNSGFSEQKETYSRNEFCNVINDREFIIKAKTKEYLDKATAYDKEYADWKLKSTALKVKHSEELEKAIIAARKARICEIEEEYKKSIDQANYEKKVSEKKRETAESQLTSLGFFDFSEKRNLKKLIKEMITIIDSSVSQIKSAEHNYQKAKQELDSWCESKRAQLRNDIENRYPIPPEPKNIFGVSRSEKSTETADSIENIKSFLRTGMEQGKLYTISEMMSEIPQLSNYEKTRVSVIVRSMIATNELERVEIDKIPYFKSTNNTGITYEQAEKLATNDYIRESILDWMISGEVYNIPKLIDQVPGLAGYSYTQVNAVMRGMVENGSIERVEIDRKSHFKLT